MRTGKARIKPRALTLQALETCQRKIRPRALTRPSHKKKSLMVDGCIGCDNAQGVGTKRYAQARLQVPPDARQRRGAAG